MKKIKDYYTFINEKVGIEDIATSKISKSLGEIITGRRKEIRLKSKEEIEENPVISRQNFGEWNKDLNGYVGLSPLFSGKVVIRESDEDDNTYEVTSGPNEGLSGNYSWNDSGNKSYPIFGKPYNKAWKDLKGPDENFLKTYKDSGDKWKSPLDGLPGIDFLPKGNSGEFMISYEDVYQLYGNVEIYYNPESTKYPHYSYKVIDGPNSGKKGDGFFVVKDAEDEKVRYRGQGILAPFSENVSFYSSDSVEFPSNLTYSDDTRSYKKGSSKYPATGYNPSQVIFLDTSELNSINPPDKNEFLKVYGKLKNSDGNSFLSENSENAGGFVSKNQYGSIDLPTSGIDGKKEFTVTSLGLKDNNLKGCFLESYLYNDLALYTVPCKRSESPKLSWNQEIGSYGNNFFTGNFLVKPNEWKLLKGEWYFDHSTKSIGLIYVYDDKGKSVDLIYNPDKIFNN